MQNKINIILSVLVIIFLLSILIIWFIINQKNTQELKNFNQISENASQETSIIDQKQDFSLRQSVLDTSDKKFNYTTVEYNKNSENYILKSFFDETYPDPLGSTSYKISYISDKYLTVRESGWELEDDHLFDLTDFREIKSSTNEAGTYSFYENDKYVLFQGMGRISWPGLSIEIIDGNQLYKCIVTEEEAEDIVVKNGILSFTEIAFSDSPDSENGELRTPKTINIEDFCKNK